MKPSSNAKPQFQILWIKPAGFLHADSLCEAVEVLRFNLARLGIDAPVAENRLLPDRVPIVIGAHLLGAGEDAQLPDAAVIYNLEQFAPGYAGSSVRYLDLLSRFRVWDMLASNVDALAAQAVNPAARYVPLGYVPGLSRVPAAEEDIDVLFFGIGSPRRKAVLQALADRGLRAIGAYGVFGAERDRLVARAKVVVNVHFAEGGKLEVPRLLYLLANRKAVVSEVSEDTASYGMEDAFVEGAYDDLPRLCAELCADAGRRRRIGRGGFASVKAHAPQVLDLLGRALGASVPQTAAPRKRNLAARDAGARCDASADIPLGVPA